MGKRKPKVQPKPVEDAPQPKMISDERLAELRLLAVNFRDVRDAVTEIDRLRAEVAAKDAEIARLAAELNVARFMNTPMDNLPAPE